MLARNENLLLKITLIKYIKERKEGPEYKSFWGRFFGYSRDDKLKAAKALLNHVQSPNSDTFKVLLENVNPLRTGDLVESWNLFKKDNPAEFALIEEALKYKEKPVVNKGDLYRADLSESDIADSMLSPRSDSSGFGLGK